MDIQSFPAPWQLRGDGYIVLFKADPAWLKQHGFIPDELKDRYIPSVGTAMFVNYAESTAGPYGELLFIPGKFRFDEGDFYSITKIYVSTMESVVNGQNNWGIPKELADFSFEQTGRQQERILVSKAGQTIADCSFRSGTLPLPINTKLLPRKMKTVAQPWGEQLIYTTPEASGSALMASMTAAEFDPQHFPDLKQVRILAVTRTRNFKMRFPLPLCQPALQ